MNQSDENRDAAARGEWLERIAQDHDFRRGEMDRLRDRMGDDMTSDEKRAYLAAHHASMRAIDLTEGEDGSLAGNINGQPVTLHREQVYGLADMLRVVLRHSPPRRPDHNEIAQELAVAGEPLRNAPGGGAA